MIKKYLEVAENWFTVPVSATIAGAFRIGFGGVLILNILLMLPWLREYFSGQGFYTAEQARIFLTQPAYSLFYFWDSLSFVYVAYIMLLLAAVGFTLGFRPRIMAGIALVLLVSFHFRNPWAFHAGDAITRIILFYCIFLQSNAAYVPKWIKHTSLSEISGWPVRLIQIQLACVYLSAGISKLASPQWWDGSYAFRMMMLPGRGYFDWGWLMDAPVLINLLTYGVIFAELTFFFFVWFASTRRLAIIMAAGLHLGILATVNVVYFSEVMLSVLVLFTKEEDWRDVWKLVRNSVGKKNRAALLPK